MRARKRKPLSVSRTVRARFRGVVFSHRQLWWAARKLREHSETLEKNKLPFEMAAVLLTLLSVEAYCNFAIEVLDPEVFKNERRVFGSRIGKKIDWLAIRANYEIDRSRRPYQTISRLRSLRDRIVHAKPETYFKELFNPPASELFLHPGELERGVRAIKVERAFEDVGRFCEALHKALRKSASKAQKRKLQPKALLGPIQRESFSATLLSRLPRSIEKQHQSRFNF